MKQNNFPCTRDLVLVGGGHTHALVLKKWGMSPFPGTRVTVINPGATAPYSGMLPGHLAGHYSRDELDIDLVRLSRFANTSIILDEATAIDPKNREIQLASGRRVAFDMASIDVGITSEMPHVEGFAEHAVPAKPLGTLAAAWQGFLDSAATGDVAVIGGGVAGVEIAMALAHRLRAHRKASRVHLIERDAALASLSDRAASKLLAALEQNGVVLHEHLKLTSITATGIVHENGFIEAKFICGAAGARPHPWISGVDLEQKDGFLSVSATLETSEPGVFATGDCAHMLEYPRSKAGVYAVRQAPVLFENLCARLAGKPPARRYVPQKDYLKLISLGGKSALGDRYGLTFQGDWVWRWKNHIDETFMSKFRALPKMERPELPPVHAEGLDDLLSGKPLCGGCGAKVGQSALQTALSKGSDALPGDDAAVIEFGASTAIISTDHLREMVLDPVVMTKIAAHHALGDIWAMGASPKAVTANIVLREMSSRLAARTLTAVMSAARDVMEAAGAVIVGGHSSQGAEMTIGFTVTGQRDGPAITLAGAKPGDRLILTKPLGSGILMAAEMMGEAKGEWVASALDLMMQSQRTASEILSTAHAMTDITGFGLIGHLNNICLNSGTGCTVQLATIPFMDGAITLADTGLRASLHEENRAVLPDLPRTARHDLLFDPQTAGGLLAAVPAGSAVLEALQANGYEAAEIGVFNGKSGQISIL